MGYINSHGSIRNSPRKLYYCICPSPIKSTSFANIFLSTSLKIQRKINTILYNLSVLRSVPFILHTITQQACTWVANIYLLRKQLRGLLKINASDFYYIGPEVDVGGMAVEAEPFHQYSIPFCCCMTDGSRGAVWWNGIWRESVDEAKVLNCSMWKKLHPLTFHNIRAHNKVILMILQSPFHFNKMPKCAALALGSEASHKEAPTNSPYAELSIWTSVFLILSSGQILTRYYILPDFIYTFWRYFLSLYAVCCLYHMDSNSCSTSLQRQQYWCNGLNWCNLYTQQCMKHVGSNLGERHYVNIKHYHSMTRTGIVN